MKWAGQEGVSLYLVETPSTPVVALDVMKEHLRVEETDTQHDDVIKLITAAVTQKFDGRDGLLQRALNDQTWDLKLPCFPNCGVIRIPLPPLIEVEWIKYVDVDLAEATFDDENYHVVGVGGGHPAHVQLRGTKIWPVIASQWPEPVTIRFRAGYIDAGDSPPSANVPEPIAQAIKLTVGHLFANRETVIVAGSAVAVEVPYAADWLLSGYKVYT